MINATQFAQAINESQTTFEIARQVYSEPTFLVPVILAFALPFLVFIIIAAVVEGKTARGQKLGRPMLLSPNIGYIFVVFFIQAILFILIFFPIWSIWID